MTYTSDNFFDWIFGIVQNVNMFQGGTNYLVIIGIVLITCILISPRKISNVKVLALPVGVGYIICGLNIPLIFLVIAGVMFIMEGLSVKGVGEFIETVGQVTKNIYTAPEKIKEKRLTKSSELKAKIGQYSDLGKFKEEGGKVNKRTLIDARKTKGEPLSITDALKKSKRKGEERVGLTGQRVDKKKKQKGLPIKVIGKKRYVEKEGRLFEVAWED